MSPFSDEELEAATQRKEQKPRPKGKLPYLPHTTDPEELRDWLTLAFCPPAGWRADTFERASRLKTDPCSITFRNGRETKTYRFSQQVDLWNRLRTTVLSVSDGTLQMPHLTAGEIEDVWAALVQLGTVLSEWDETDETRKWVDQFLGVTHVLEGFTLVPDGRHDAMMAVRGLGEFGRADAQALLRPAPGADMRWQKRPVRVVDKATGEQWVRCGELTTYVRYVCGVEPLPHGGLTGRLHEIGVERRHFEDYRPPHPKLNLYKLPAELVEHAQNGR